MTADQLRALDPALSQFLAQFRPHCEYAPTFGHLNTYVRGLLSDLPRKTAEPVAIAAGTHAGVGGLARFYGCSCEVV